MSIDVFIEAITSLHEDDFTKEILIPLFKNLEYENAKFNGGVYEFGKDILLIKKNPFGQTEVDVAQVKKIESERSHKNTSKMEDAIRQLNQCRRHKVRLADGKEYQPRTLILITPYVVDSRLVEDYYKEFDYESTSTIFLDGQAVYGLIKEKCPHVLESFIGIEEKISNVDKKELINEELYSALSYRTDIDIVDFYNDLEFFVGNFNSNAFINNELFISSEKHEVKDEDWGEFKDRMMKISDLIGFDPISEGICHIETKYQEESEKYHSRENRLSLAEIDERQEINSVLFQVLLKNLKEARELNSVLQNRAIESGSDTISFDKAGALLSIDLKLDKLCLFELNRDINGLSLEGFSKELANRIRDISVESGEVLHNLIAVEKIRGEVVPKPVYVVSFKSKGIEEWMLESKSVFISGLERFKEIYQLLELSDFLDHVEKIMRFVSAFLESEKYCKGLLNFKNKQNQISSRLTVSAHTIIQTGRNVAIYGPAGAGKTTTLQAYAAKFKPRKGEYVIYLPLNRVFNKGGNSSYIKALYSEGFSVNLDQYIKIFWSMIALYKGIELTKPNVDDFVEIVNTSNRLVLLLDGLDEVYSSSPWIVDVISRLEQERKVQVVASSRDCMSYINDIDFLGVTLLPFTNDQVKKFFLAMLGSDDIYNKLKKSSLLDLAKSPLLASIICSLHQQGVNVPNSEVDIYRSHIQLLCGHYDKHKGVSRIKNNSNILFEAAKKLAYGMHKKRVRELSYLGMLKILNSALSYKVSSESIEEILSELISPCNMLVRGDDLDLYTFGHLRYQEYLASEELKQNKVIMGYLNDSWWKGSLYLYALENPLEDLVNDIYDMRGNLAVYAEGLKYLVKARPINERKSLVEIIDRHIEQDRFDGFTENYADSESYASVRDYRNWDELLI